MTAPSPTATAGLVAALRVAKKHPPTDALLDEAISTIDRLTEEVARLRAENEKLCHDLNSYINLAGDLMTKIDRLTEEVARLRETLRSHVIFRHHDNPNDATCNECNGAWTDGIERHEPDCRAALPKETT